jgi:nucleoside-diphosphate-sugar epimerase
LAIDRQSLPPDWTACLQSELSSPAIVDAILDQGLDTAFVLAGTGSVAKSLEDPEQDLADNAAQLVHFLESTRRRIPHLRLVYVSSAAVYGEAEELPIKESAPLGPISPYGVSKLAGESYARVYHHLYGVQALVARPFSVYGPGARKQVVWDLLVKLHQDGEAVLAGTGQETRDYLFVDDLCQALIRIAVAGEAGQTFNVCSGRETPLADLAARVCRLAGKPPVRFAGQARPGDPLRWCGDPGRLISIGWQPQVDLDDGLARTLAWYLSLKGA